MQKEDNDYGTLTLRYIDEKVLSSNHTAFKTFASTAIEAFETLIEYL